MISSLTKTLSFFLSFCLILEQTVFAQSIDLSHYFANSGKTVIQSDKFRPLHLRYISYDTETNDFQILLDKGDFFNQKTEKPKNGKTPEFLNSSTPKLEETTQELMKYFFIGLSLPNEKFWVNLRPDSPDNILDPDLEKTDIGRIFLEADLQLKKDTSGMTSPQTPEGKAYWDKLYKKAGELFSSQNITIPTITRPWIVPGETIIGESSEGAYIYKATLKVMLEEDYLTSRGGSRTAPTYQQYAFSDPRLKELNEYSTRQIKETIIPKLTYEINTSKRYARLRQVYYSLILSQWFKQKYGSAGSVRAPGTLPVRQAGSAPANKYIDLIDSSNLANLKSSQPYDKQTYFRQYQKSFKDGEYNLQEPAYTPTGQNIRRYMSGGVLVEKIASSAVVFQENNPHLSRGYLIPVPTESASPLNSTEKTAKELTKALFNPEQENKRLFVWKENDKGKITPEIFKKIIESITDERTRNPGFARTMRPEEILIALVIRIITDTIKMDRRYPEKSQIQLFKDVIYDYIAIKNGQPRSDQMEKHTKEYMSRFGKSIPRIYSLITNIKNGLEKIIDFKPILPILKVWGELFHKQNDTNFILEWGKQLEKYNKKELLSIRKISSEDMRGLPKTGIITGLPGNFTLNVCQKNSAKDFEYYWNPNKKGNVLYLRNRNRETPRDIWITFYGATGGEINKVSIGWLNKDSAEFEFGENIPLSRNGIIDLTQLTRYEGVKRLLSSSPAVENNKDYDAANLINFANELTEKEWDNIYEEASKTDGLWKPINNNVYNFETTMAYPIIGFRNNDVFIITNMETQRKFVLKHSRSSSEAKIHKKLIEQGIAVPAIFSLNDTLDKKYILMNFLEGENIAAQIYNSKGSSDKLIYLFGIFNNKDTLDDFIKNIKAMDANHVLHNDLDDFKNMLFVKDKIVFIDFHLAKEEPETVNNAVPLIKSLDSWISRAREEIKNNYNQHNEYIKKVKDSIAFAESMIAQLSSSPAFNNPVPEKGGIDFHALPIETRQIDSLQSLADSPLAVNPNLDFEGEWRGIQMVFNAGIRPSARRMAEFAVSASASPLNSRRLEDVRGLVTDLLRRDEEDEKPAPADPALKELLAIL